jgi:type VI protein secretion system component Hcp
MPIAAHFLKLSDEGKKPVEGESEGHYSEGLIDISGWSWSVKNQAAADSNATSTSGEMGPNNEPSTFTFNKPTDRSTVRLIQAMDTSEEFKSATFTLLEELRGGPATDVTPFKLEVELKKVKVISYQLSVSTAETGIELDETWTFSYSSIGYDFKSAGFQVLFDLPPGAKKEPPKRVVADLSKTIAGLTEQQKKELADHVKGGK